MKEGSFDKIWKYLETKKLMKERLVFNHVALTTISNGHLKVDRVFYLGSISNSKFRTIENDFAPTSSLRRSLTMSGHLRIPGPPFLSSSLPFPPLFFFSYLISICNLQLY